MWTASSPAETGSDGSCLVEATTRPLGECMTRPSREPRTPGQSNLRQSLISCPGKMKVKKLKIVLLRG